MLNAEHGKWLKDNFFTGYIQAIDNTKAKKPNIAHIWGPEKEFMTNHVLHPFIKHFWTHANKPNMVSVLKVGLSHPVWNWGANNSVESEEVSGEPLQDFWQKYHHWYSHSTSSPLLHQC